MIRRSQSHAHYHRILLFDVETTGLIPKADKLTKIGPTIEECPHILQLSFIVYNMYENYIEKVYNKYICVDPSVEISPKIIELTGITREKCDRGVSIQVALYQFCRAYVNCDCIVAHNLEFDSKMIKFELVRNAKTLIGGFRNIFNSEYETKYKIDNYCTMMNSIYKCGHAVSAVDKNNEPYTYMKFPKLAETYECLFRYTPEHLHNSMMDVLVCLRCYLKLRHNLDMSESKFDFWVGKYI